MKISLFAHIITLLLAFQITAISTNAFNVLEIDDESKDICIEQKSKNKKETLPALPELEEEEEIISHNKNWLLISKSSNRLITIFEFGYLDREVLKHTLETSSPPPRS